MLACRQWIVAANDHLQQRIGIGARSAVACAVLQLLVSAAPVRSQTPQPTATEEVASPPAATDVSPQTAGSTRAAARKSGTHQRTRQAVQESAGTAAAENVAAGAGGFQRHMKGASGGLSLWGASSVATGRVKCAVAENGGADCKAAADALCRSKNFSAGQERRYRSDADMFGGSVAAVRPQVETGCLPHRLFRHAGNVPG